MRQKKHPHLCWSNAPCTKEICMHKYTNMMDKLGVQHVRRGDSDYLTKACSLQSYRQSTSIHLKLHYCGLSYLFYSLLLRTPWLSQAQRLLFSPAPFLSSPAYQESEYKQSKLLELSNLLWHKHYMCQIVSYNKSIVH